MSNRKNRGDGSIRKRSDGRWEGRYTAGRNEETGKLIYKSVLARTQAECKRQLREAVWNREHKATPLTGLAQETQGTSAPQMNCQEYTVAQWLQTWYDLYAKQNIRESTQIQYSYFMNQLVIPQIGEVPLSQLTGLRLQILYQDLRINGRVHSQKRASSGLSPKTVRSVHMFLHAALEQAVRAGIIAKNPTMECKPPKLDRKEMKVIQPEQIGDYLDEIRQNLPVELRQAQSIVSDRAQLIESANAQAQAIVKKAEERARVLVSEAEIVKAAQQRAGEIVSAAQTEARTVRQTVTDYCDNMLKTTEETMAENAAQVKNVRANLRQSPRKQL